MAHRLADGRAERALSAMALAVADGAPGPALVAGHPPDAVSGTDAVAVLAAAALVVMTVGLAVELIRLGRAADRLMAAIEPPR